MAAADQSPAEPMPEPALLALARKNFGALSRAEEELFRAAQQGRIASALAGDEETDNPDDAAHWPAERAVRATCISWVCTDKQALALVSNNGLELHGMRIDGAVDLSRVDIKSSLRAWKCAFLEDISLMDARLRGLYLIDCRIKSLHAGRAIIEGPVFLRSGFKAKGKVHLNGSKIGGNLDCAGAQISNADDRALEADGAKIEGSIFLHDFKAEGMVSLVASTIGGSLECDGAQFSNAKHVALTANRAKIEGSVFLRNGFRSEGEVHLLATEIGRTLDCSDAQFSDAKGRALTAENSTIGGTAFLGGGFTAEGEVSLLGATIGTLVIREIIGAEQMILNLRLTQVGTFWDVEGSWPQAGNLFLDGFRYERLFEEAPFDAKSRKKWLSLQPRNKFWPQPYERLAAVLRQMGHERDARLVMIEKNHERARFTDFPRQAWWWYNVFGRLIGYGYAPWRAFAISVAMIVLGTILFYFGSKHGLISPTSDKAYAKAPNGQVMIENGPQRISEEYPVFNAFFYSLESFTPLLKLDQSANWAPNANQGPEIPLFRFWTPPAGELLRYYLYFHIASGWLLTSLWVGAITGLVKT